MNVITLACGDRAGSIPIDLDEVVYVNDLCREPGNLARWTDGADRVVMIVHRDDLSLAKVQKRVRAAGVDPLGVQYVSAETIAGDARRAAVLIDGATARATAFVESRPEHSRPRFGGRRSRRDLLSVPQPYYEAVPVIDEDVCAAANGCRACVTECPQAAYEWSLGRIDFDRDACVTCGRCVTACPTSAIGNPTVGSGALERQITSLVAGASPEPLGIAFVCQQRTRPVASAGWAELEVPCTGMVPATWPIAALMLGGSATAVVPCSVSGCGLASDERATDSVRLARELLAAAGFDPAAACLEPGDLSASLGPIAVADPFGLHGPTSVALALQSVATPAGPVTASGRMASRGLITIDPGVCTLCLGCTETCPTGALQNHVSSGQLEVRFDAARCTGCAQCVPVCPEVERGAIRVERCIDASALDTGPTTLAASTTPTCELCGAPIASTAMLDRLSELLGDQHDAAMEYLERRCLNCRGAY